MSVQSKTKFEKPISVNIEEVDVTKITLAEPTFNQRDQAGVYSAGVMYEGKKVNMILPEFLTKRPVSKKEHIDNDTKRVKSISWSFGITLDPNVPEQKVVADKLREIEVKIRELYAKYLMDDKVKGWTGGSLLLKGYLREEVKKMMGDAVSVLPDMTKPGSLYFPLQDKKGVSDKTKKEYHIKTKFYFRSGYDPKTGQPVLLDIPWTDDDYNKAYNVNCNSDVYKAAWAIRNHQFRFKTYMSLFDCFNIISAGNGIRWNTGDVVISSFGDKWDYTQGPDPLLMLEENRQQIEANSDFIKNLAIGDCIIPSNSPPSDIKKPALNNAELNKIFMTPGTGGDLTLEGHENTPPPQPQLPPTPVFNTQPQPQPEVKQEQQQSLFGGIPTNNFPTSNFFNNQQPTQ